ncbi:MAG: DUF721 domain-containing protein, partial [Puniceicoccales bacterium]|nr:DUF721 domain-containing protein [Puniceicoccales bacterium]
KFSQKVENLIADFRELPRDNSMATLHEAYSAEQLFRNILKKYTVKSDIKIESEIIENWPAIVGDTFCMLCTPHKISPDGALIIKVQNSVIRQELFLRKEEFLRQIRHFCPASYIKNIGFSL